MAEAIAVSNETLFDDPLHANDSQRTDLKQSLHKTKAIIDYYLSWDLNESSRSLFIALSTSADVAGAQSTTTEASAEPLPDTTVHSTSTESVDRQPHEDKHSVPALTGKSLTLAISRLRNLGVVTKTTSRVRLDTVSDVPTMLRTAHVKERKLEHSLSTALLTFERMLRLSSYHMQTCARSFSDRGYFA